MFKFFKKKYGIPTQPTVPKMPPVKGDSEIEKSIHYLQTNIDITKAVYGQFKVPDDITKSQLRNSEVAIEALKKQIPKKIEVWNGQASCPCCEKLYGNANDIKKLIHWEFPYCKFCGQKIDWSVEE